MASLVVPFYRGECTDHRGRTIQDILAMEDFWLEHTHDYIQWLFPIPERGRFNGFAPVLDQEAQASFAQSPELQAQQVRCLDRMLDFLGLTRNGMDIQAGPDLNPKDHIWLKAGGHNHLRISRLIRSLRYCRQQELASHFQKSVTSIGYHYGYVREETLRYWCSATDH